MGYLSLNTHMGHLNVSILASTSVPFRLNTTVQMPNLALIDTKRITVQCSIHISPVPVLWGEIVLQPPASCCTAGLVQVQRELTVIQDLKDQKCFFICIYRLQTNCEIYLSVIGVVSIKANWWRRRDGPGTALYQGTKGEPGGYQGPWHWFL